MSENNNTRELKKRSLTIMNAYEEFYENKYELTRAEYRLILKTFNHMLMRYMIETGNAIRFPKLLGLLKINKRKAGEAFDYKYYMETGKIRIHKNKHSAGYYAKWYWDQSSPRTNYPFQGLWKFKATRDHNRFLAKQIKEHNYINKYYEYDNN